MKAATWVITITSGVTSAIGIYVMIPFEGYSIFLVVLGILVVIAFITFLMIWSRYDKIDNEWIEKDNEWWNNPEIRVKSPWEML
jgi:hypothetical protein